MESVDKKLIDEISSKLGITLSIAESLIRSGFSSIESIRSIKIDDLKNIDGIGDVTAERIISKIKQISEEPVSLISCFGKYPKDDKVTEKCRFCAEHVACKAKR